MKHLIRGKIAAVRGAARRTRACLGRMAPHAFQQAFFFGGLVGLGLAAWMERRSLGVAIWSIEALYLAKLITEAEGTR